MHGIYMANTKIYTMVVPGFVAEVRTRFSKAKEYQIPCHEFCGLGHQAMWGHVVVVPQEQFANVEPVVGRATCEQ
jgi:cytochrome c oxidase subunit 2